MKRNILAMTVGLVCGTIIVGCGNQTAEVDNVEISTTINVLDIVGKENAATDGELIEVDPFERLDVVFAGTAPSGTADIKYVHPADYPMSYSFEIEPRLDLRNGDIVRMYITDEDAEQTANDNGYTLTATEKEYIVEGLDFYVESLNQITDELQDAMNKRAGDFIKDNVDRRMKGVTLLDYALVGNYLLCQAKDVKSGLWNHCYSVYKVNASCPSGEVTYYYYVEFSSLEIRNGRNDNFWDGLGSTNIFYVGEYKFIGYETLDEVLAACNGIMEEQTANGNYTFESNMTE